MDEKITIELDDAVLEALSRQAEAHGKSVGDEARAIVTERVAMRKTMSAEEAIRRSREIRAMTPKGVPQTDSLVRLREDRAR